MPSALATAAQALTQCAGQAECWSAKCKARTDVLGVDVQRDVVPSPELQASVVSNIMSYLPQSGQTVLCKAVGASANLIDPIDIIHACAGKDVEH